MISDDNLDDFLQSEIPGISLEDLNVDEKRALALSLLPPSETDTPAPLNNSRGASLEGGSSSGSIHAA